jgi:hypothetical protein
MEVIKKKLLKSNNDINFTIKLDQEFNLTGYYNYDIDKTNTNSTRSVIVTGICDSRLNEITKYGFGNNLLSDKYHVYNGSNNGVILNKSNNNVITYKIDNIEFEDNLLTNQTNFLIKTNKIEDIKEKVLFLDDKYYSYIDIKINNNLLIDRQSISILQEHYRLNGVNNIKDFEFYGNGYFNIYKI